MQSNHPRSVEPNSDRSTPQKPNPLVTVARWCRAVEDPLMVVLLVWAFLFVALLLINALL